jgi:hypothetical protein
MIGLNQNQNAMTSYNGVGQVVPPINNSIHGGAQFSHIGIWDSLGGHNSLASEAHKIANSQANGHQEEQQRFEDIDPKTAKEKEEADKLWFEIADESVADYNLWDAEGSPNQKQQQQPSSGATKKKKANKKGLNGQQGPPKAKGSRSQRAKVAKSHPSNQLPINDVQTPIRQFIC